MSYSQHFFRVKPGKLWLALIFQCCCLVVFSQETKEVSRFLIDEARQGVAVDASYFYVINNSSITKHQKSDGALVKKWDGTEEGIITHLNSGIIIDGKLYCANSNYPESPMASSIEIFDPGTLNHIGNHSFGIYAGSATWVDHYDGYWWVGFAHYIGRGSTAGKDNRWTTLIKFDLEWRQVASWVFPKEVIKAFGTRSNSGGTWGKNGLLYCTGHDESQIYVLKLPDKGFTLQLVQTLPANIHGQGIAWDHWSEKKLLYGIIKSENTVTVTAIE